MLGSYSSCWQNEVSVLFECTVQVPKVPNISNQTYRVIRTAKHTTINQVKCHRRRLISQRWQVSFHAFSPTLYV